jgi:hypothetical protein
VPWCCLFVRLRLGLFRHLRTRMQIKAAYQRITCFPQAFS